MPIHDLGYRAWDGRLSSLALRWSVIAHTGIGLAWQNRLLRRLILAAWLPAMYVGVAFFLFEQSTLYPEMQRDAIEAFKNMYGMTGESLLSAALANDPDQARHQIWGFLLHIFFRFPQGLLMALVVGLVAPPLISQDVRTRALLLYFSRPITRIEYVAGKMAIVCAYVGMITTVPALALYVFGTLLSPDLSVLSSTWDFPLRIVAASIVLMLPTAALALAFSSLTPRSYYAGFAWFATWVFGFVTYYTILGVQGIDFDERWALVSLHETLGNVQTWIFGVNPSFAEAAPSIAMLVGITLISLTVVFRRVSSCMQV